VRIEHDAEERRELVRQVARALVEQLEQDVDVASSTPRSAARSAVVVTAGAVATRGHRRKCAHLRIAHLI
jgi:hypothetical protein